MNRKQLALVMQEHESSLLAYTSSFVGTHNACDIVQEAFMDLLCTRLPIRNKRSWLFKVCRNKCIDMLRKDGRMHELEEGARLATEQDPAERIHKQESTQELHKVLETLPLQKREVLRLKFQENMSYAAIAEITGLSANHVGVVLHNALQLLRAHPQFRACMQRGDLGKGAQS